MFRFKGADVAYVCYKADSEAGAEATAAADTPRQNDQTPFVLVHGFGLSSFHWNRLAPILAKASNRDVYAIDLLGFGKSAKTMPQGERLSTKLWGELIAAFAAEVCGGAYVVGNSIGSLSALQALACPSNGTFVRGAVCVNVAGGMNNNVRMLDTDFEYDPNLRLIYVPFKAVLAVLNALLKTKWVAKRLFDGVRSPEGVGNALKTFYPFNPEHVDDDLVKSVVAPAEDEDALDAFVAMLTDDAGERPEIIYDQVLEAARLANRQPPPLCIVWGECDTATPLGGAIAQHFQKLSKVQENDATLRFTVLEGHQHFPHDDEPELVVDSIMAWQCAVETKKSVIP